MKKMLGFLLCCVNAGSFAGQEELVSSHKRAIILNRVKPQNLLFGLHVDTVNSQEIVLDVQQTVDQIPSLNEEIARLRLQLVAMQNKRRIEMCEGVSLGCFSGVLLSTIIYAIVVLSMR